MQRRLAPLLFAVLMLAALALPAVAITNGTKDVGNEFPAVGMLLFFDPDFQDDRFDDPGAWFSCSGTLLSDTVLLTAGHCTFGVGTNGETTDGGVGGNDMWVAFQVENDLSGFLAPSSDYLPDRNQERYDDWSAALNANPDWHRGTATPHPDYDDDLFFQFDAGVVVFDEPIPPAVHQDDFGVLPAQGHLDQFLTGRGSQQRFTPVGYGLLSGFPFFEPDEDDSRYFASVMLVDGKGVFGIEEGIAVVFSNNKGQHATGGTCFGDSGGPVFDGDTRTIVAVTSFGVNLTCTGTGGGYRIDQPDDLDFIGGIRNGNG